MMCDCLLCSHCTYFYGSQQKGRLFSPEWVSGVSTWSVVFPCYRKWLLWVAVGSSRLGGVWKHVPAALSLVSSISSLKIHALPHSLPAIFCPGHAVCPEQHCLLWHLASLSLSCMKETDCLKSKGKFSERVLGKQQLPVVTCIFPSSVYFHCLQIYNSVSLIMLLGLLLSALTHHGCFELNKEVF